MTGEIDFISCEFDDRKGLNIQCSDRDVCRRLGIRRKTKKSDAQMIAQAFTKMGEEKERNLYKEVAKKGQGGKGRGKVVGQNSTIQSDTLAGGMVLTGLKSRCSRLNQLVYCPQNEVQYTPYRTCEEGKYSNQETERSSKLHL